MLGVSLRLVVMKDQFIIIYLHAGGSAHSNAYFGTGSGPIFLSNVQCNLNSSQLLQCFSQPILYHNCIHSEDAGVSCNGKVHKYQSFQLIA